MRSTLWGFLQRLRNISEEDVLQVRTTDRLEISDPSVEEGKIHVSFVLRPPVEDMGEEEQQAEFHRAAHSPCSALSRVISGDCGAGLYPAAQKYERHGVPPCPSI